MVRLFEDPGVARIDDAPRGATWRNALWQTRLNRAARPRPGPVHLNAAFVEPLVGQRVTCLHGEGIGAES
jgi:2-succinyl-5-enolpyruvyl-6-hydroxy-3-cyclohexene-1-carboxylate synthase